MPHDSLPAPKVRSLGKMDLEFAARLHASALPGGFFPARGHRFLRAYYETFRRSPYGVAILVHAHGSPGGVLVGWTSDPASVHVATCSEVLTSVPVRSVRTTTADA